MEKQKSLLVTFILYSITIIIGFLLVSTLQNTYSLFVSTLIADVVMTLIIFVCSLYFNNSSLYDPYWSVIPIFIVLYWILTIQIDSFNMWLLFTGVLIWGLRLTLNWGTNFKGYSFEI